MPDFLHVIPIRHDTVLDQQRAAFVSRPGLAATVAIAGRAVDLGANR